MEKKAWRKSHCPGFNRSGIILSGILCLCTLTNQLSKQTDNKGELTIFDTVFSVDLV